MGSGLFLAAVVVAWFVVLVPMVLTRRDNALESVIRENDTSSARVLRRKPKPKAAGQRQRSYPMSARETSHSHDLDDAVDTHDHDESRAYEPARPRERGPRRTDAARKQMLQRRRQTLLGLGGFFLFALALAFFAGTWTWVIAAASGVALAAYVVHLRNETRREEERRLTRGFEVNRARADVMDRSETRSQSSLAANAFVASTITEPEVVSLDDEDPELYDLGDATVADSIDLSGQRHSEYQDSPDYYDWDDDYYDDPRYGIDGTGSDDDKQYPRAV